MHNFSIPVCFFPSTVLFLDDNRDFLLNFILQLDENMAYQIFDKPESALKFVQDNNCTLDELNQSCLSEYADAKNLFSASQTVNVDLAAIHAELYNPRRFNEISVVVVDYAMPGMNGIEFCRRLENNQIKKILLTGMADEHLAVEAFNEGLIHRYIKKSDMEASDLITQSINELQNQYYQEMSRVIVKMLSVSSPTCLKDKKFANFFHEFCAEKNIVEYYLMDTTGSFIMLDMEANISFLVVKKEQDLEASATFAKENNAADDVIRQLESKAVVPFLWHKIKSQKENFDWSTHVLPATKIEGDEIYYYGYIKSNEHLEVNHDKIVSYNSYLENLDRDALVSIPNKLGKN